MIIVIFSEVGRLCKISTLYYYRYRLKISLVVDTLRATTNHPSRSTETKRLIVSDARAREYSISLHVDIDAKMKNAILNRMSDIFLV